MGREKKMLLALLSVLACAFVGVLLTKLLVPRPPTGAGPDVHAEDSAAQSHDLVEPPAFSSGGGSESTSSFVESRSRRTTSDFGGGSRFSNSAREASAQAASRQSELMKQELTKQELTKQDPFVRPAALEQPLPAATLDAVPVIPAGPSGPPSRSTGVAAGSWYVAAVGDSWWSLAERAYGDGRLYRALFAWNRVLDPRVSLAPGTRLEIPPQSRLESAWPKLVSFGAPDGG
ncbi:MAG: LysM peptidoglycan-binding domain-containing protein [Planctomycetota bacterium]|nr:MAG: LysM peptidoglycan-binding domain-containing protein [Planctomycetota bacterium]